MSNDTALRIRHEHQIDISENISDISNQFTLEAWVCPAPMDRAARLYPESGYNGQPVRLKPGLYRNIADEHLPSLGSACLPEEIEAVFFTEPDFKGEALAQRDDLHEAPDSHRQIGSVVVLDRSHRRQNCAVLFEQERFQGSAEVLTLPDFWQQPDGTSTVARPGLTQVGSAWTPPGVALDVTKLLPSPAVASGPIEPQLLHFTAQAEGEDDETSLETLPFAWPTAPPLFRTVNVPPDHSLYIFEKANYGGRFAVFSGKQQDLSIPPWPIESAIYVASPNGANGVIGIRSTGGEGEPPEVRLFPPGAPMPENSVEWHFWVQPNFLLKPEKETSENPEVLGAGQHHYDEQEWGPGFYKNILVYSHTVVQIERTTLLGDLAKLPDGIIRIEPRRDAPLAGTEMIYTTDDDPNGEKTSPPHVWYDTPPAFKTVRIPTRRALLLFEEANFGGRHEIVVDGRDDLSNLLWIPQSAAYADAPDDVDGVLCTSPAVKIFAPGSSLPAETDAWFPPGYCLVKDSGESMQANGLLQGKNLEGYTVERYLGIISNDAGYGLTINRLAGALRGAPDELRFGDTLLRPDRWYHLAQTCDGQTLQWILDGRPVKQLAVPADMQIESPAWVLGHGFRGALAQCRAWHLANPVEIIRDLRYPGASRITVFGYEDGSPRPIEMPNITSFAQAPDAVVTSADLPQAPADTVLVKSMIQDAEAKHHQYLQAAREDAAAQTAQARKRAQRKLALAREQARRDVHFKGIKMLDFVRGNEVITPIAPFGFQKASRWSALAQGVNGGVFALVCDSEDNLYVGGGHRGRRGKG